MAVHDCRATSTSPRPVCRFCLDAESDDTEFVDEPCLCRGSAKFVHMTCLEQHFVARGQWHNFKCPTCKQCYQGKALKKLAEISLDRMDEEYGDEALQTAHSLCYLAQAHTHLGNTVESKKILERRLQIEEQQLGIGHVVTASTLCDLAAAYGKLGNFQKQKQLLQRSLSIKEANYGVGHISTAVVFNNLAIAHSELGEPLKEKELLERSLEIKAKHFGKDHVQLAATLVNLAGVYSELGDAVKSCKVLKHALAVEEKHYGVGHTETAITLNNLAFACGETGDFLGMRHHLQKSLAIKERHYGKNHLESCLTHANLGVAHCMLGEMNIAKECITQALSACADASKNRRCGTVLMNAAVIHKALGEDSLAEDFAIHASSLMCEIMGVVAAERALKLETARTTRIWSKAGSDAEAKWLEHFLEQEIKELDVASLSTAYASTSASSPTVASTCSFAGDFDTDLDDLPDSP